MLSFSDLAVANRVRKLLSKNQIEVAHYIPGRLRLKSPVWKKQGERFRQFISEIEQGAGIQSVTYTPETGSLLVLFDPVVLNDLQTIETWLSRAEEVI